MKLYSKDDYLKAAELGEVSMIDARHVVSLLDEVTEGKDHVPEAGKMMTLAEWYEDYKTINKVNIPLYKLLPKYAAYVAEIKERKAALAAWKAARKRYINTDTEMTMAGELAFEKWYDYWKEEIK